MFLSMNDIIYIVLAAAAIAALFISILYNRKTTKMNEAIALQNKEMHEQYKLIQENQLKNALFDKRFKLITAFMRAAVSRNYKPYLQELIEKKPVAAALFDQDCLDIFNSIYEDMILTVQGHIPDYRENRSEAIDFALTINIIERINKILAAIRIDA